MKIVELPIQDGVDIPLGLRELANAIEAGDYDDAHNVVWVIDCGNSRVELGLLGRSASRGAESHLLLAIAMRRLESGS